MARKTGYLDAVDAIAREAIEEYPDPEGQHDERARWVTESVDGSEWIIYDAKNEQVLESTRNEPDARDVRAMSAPDADWKTMRTLAAFLAMEADVHQRIRELDEGRGRKG
jgi:hypothetical protein